MLSKNGSRRSNPALRLQIAISTVEPLGRIDKTVFLSYRHTNAVWARAIFQDLNSNGYDVFFDFDGIASGDFEGVIVENIRSRAHFLVLLTPAALQRCGDEKDWLRREIETALESKRNIVPLMLEGFDFAMSSNQLVGPLSVLQRYNGLRVHVDYFDDAMRRLREKYLNVPLDAVLHPASLPARQAAADQRAAAVNAPAITEKELREAEQPRYLFTVKIRYRDELQTIEGTHAQAPHPGGLIVYDREMVVARYSDKVDEWSRGPRIG
jgi:TIR domain